MVSDSAAKSLFRRQSSATMPPMKNVEIWDVFEIELNGSEKGNPYLDATLSATFKKGHREIAVSGFYDGNGVYRVRFMPDSLGQWSYVTQSNSAELDSQTGEFVCSEASAGNHGPVRVSRNIHFRYEDGEPYYPFGTTCYVWNHQGEALEKQTIDTLSRSPFNKIRMCVFPKHYDFNKNEPDFYVFEGSVEKGWDFTRFSPEYFRHLEKKIADLRDLGIEADLILFHPYDRWGFATMESEVDDRYLKYLVARLAAYRNVWWSFANEFDLMKDKNEADWDRFFKIVQEYDPYQHLRSVHNCRGFYDYKKPWVTHCSIQRADLSQVNRWIEQFGKPIVVDECRYEGTIHHDWGNITPQEMVHKFWEGCIRGGYVGHGETYTHPDDILWWSKGGVLHGSSPSRIAFLREIIEQHADGGIDPNSIGGPVASGHRNKNCYLFYMGNSQPALKLFKLPEDRRYSAEIIDAWEMTVTAVEGSHSGNTRIDLPAKPYIAVCFTAQE